MPMSTLRLVVQPIAVAVALAFAVRASSVGIYSIPSASMEPTLQVGDTIVVTPYFGTQHPQRGDVVVFRSPVSSADLVVKRVIGTPGDMVENRDGRVSVRGVTLAEPYTPPGIATIGIAPQIVPANCYFLLGDNRVNSVDSRQWGVIDNRAIVGRARLVLWSSGADASATPAQATPLTDAPRPHVRSVRLFRAIR